MIECVFSHGFFIKLDKCRFECYFNDFDFMRVIFCICDVYESTREGVCLILFRSLCLLYFIVFDVIFILSLDEIFIMWLSTFLN